MERKWNGNGVALEWEWKENVMEMEWHWNGDGKEIEWEWSGIGGGSRSPPAMYEICSSEPSPTSYVANLFM